MIHTGNGYEGPRPIETYRVLRPDKRRFWKRTWQAEWDGCVWAPRAYTEVGVWKKAVRWIGWSPTRLDLYVARRRALRKLGAFLGVPA